MLTYLWLLIFSIVLISAIESNDLLSISSITPSSRIERGAVVKSRKVTTRRKDDDRRKTTEKRAQTTTTTRAPNTDEERK
ncbi:unnamed protein product, partial [Mesorhabditis belari]|uniref:Uncharacterized protein n=1 Tax=Mesorhabditis belari TaxID=2138241 RepID=A0AAF3EL40_9BILA